MKNIIEKKLQHLDWVLIQKFWSGIGPEWFKNVLIWFINIPIDL